MQVSHNPAKIHASFDEANLVSRVGLVPVMALADRAGLAELVRERVAIDHPCGVNPDLKIGSIVAGMAAGADCIDDMDLLRHGAMGRLFAGVRAPSTLGSHLRAYTWGHARQLESAGRSLLVALAQRAPLLPGAGKLTFVDLDSTQKRVYGHQKHGAAFGHAKIGGKSLLVRGLNALTATVSTPTAAPVIAATRLRSGNAASARGAASLAAEAIGTAREAGCSGTLVVRADSAFYSAAFTNACRRAGGYFSVTVRMDPKIGQTIAGIGEDAWTPIRYPQAIYDEQLGQWVSDAEVAEVGYTAFTSKKTQAVTGRLIVRRVKDQNRKVAATGQAELFPVWRYHAVFTDSPYETIQAEEQHRGHAIIEQTYADWNDGALAHLPSGSFPANAAWLTCAAIAANLTRAAGCLASTFHARARAATIRDQLINLAARIARHGRGHLTLHLPEGWHREHEWLALFTAACDPPRTPAAA